MKLWTMFRKTLRDVRGMTIGIALFLAIIALLDIAIYPSFKDTLTDFQIPAAMEGLLGETADMGSPEGFITAEFFSWVPLVLMILAISGGTSAFAGEEGEGTIDLLLSQPIKRWEFATAKTLALASAVTIAALAALPGFAIGLALVDFEIDMGRLAAAVVYMLPVAFLVTSLSVLASAVFPNRGSAAMAVTAFVIVSYFIQVLSDAAPVLDTVRKASIFHWAEPSRVVIGGFDWTRAAVLLVLAIVAAGLAVWSFERRDLSSGAREWRLHDLIDRVHPRRDKAVPS